jgi:hypothetical protein
MMMMIYNTHFIQPSDIISCTMMTMTIMMIRMTTPTTMTTTMMKMIVYNRAHTNGAGKQ